MPDSRLFVTFHLPTGTHLKRVDGLMDIGDYERARDEYRRQVVASGGTLDSTEADQEWATTQAARVQWDAAYQEWFAAGAPTGGHPGGLEEYVDG
jgi:hypothetical protein